jgi:hypothetical protein
MSWRAALIPQLSRPQFLASLEIAAIGALIAGTYGAIHDQISYTISPEYFTKMKFEQFAHADFGWPERGFTALIGFLATWWVGLIGGWILARVGLAALPTEIRRRRTLQAFAIVVGTAVVCGAIGAGVGWIATAVSLEPWSYIQQALDIEDLRNFLVVAFLHEAGYLGAALGVIIAGIWVWRRGRLS